MSPSYRGIFVTDLDGTLLRDGRISEPDIGALRDLGDRGILRVIATGRSLYSATACLDPDFPADYLILSTGSQVVTWPERQVTRSTSLREDEVRDICRLLRSLDVNFMVHEDFPHNHRFVYHRGPRQVEDFDRRLALYRGHAREAGNCAEARPAAQVVAIVDGSDAAMHDRIIGRLGGHSVIRATSPLDGRSAWIEIFAADVSKASGIRHLVDRHGLHETLSAAIGNDHNDRDMLDLVHMPFKVADAFLDDEDKYITTPDRCDAVAYAIARYLETLGSGTASA